MFARTNRFTFLACTLASSALAGCFSLSPRFDTAVHHAINREDMRRMATEGLVLYYPDGTREQTLQIASRLVVLPARVPGCGPAERRSRRREVRVRAAARAHQQRLCLPEVTGQAARGVRSRREATPSLAAALGAALEFRFWLWKQPLPLGVQVARHLSYDDAWVLYLAFGKRLL
jgi:hypothetical protein